MRFAKTLAATVDRASPTEAVVVPRTFLDFCAWLGVELTPGQSELCRVAYDGCSPVDREIASRIFGGPDVPVGIRSVVAAVCGARAGKSYVLVALRLVWGMLMRDVSALPPGQRASALIIAPRDDHRMEVMRYAIGAVLSKPELERMLVGKPRSEDFTLRRPDGQEVDFRTGVATMGGTAARGAWWTDVALDECAFFRNASYKINDEEIFKAATARVLPGGQMILASTPWDQSGLLYESWRSRPDNVLVAHAPTLLLHDSQLTRDIVAREQARDPDNARREYGAEFMTSGSTVFFEASSIDAALCDEAFEPRPGDLIAAGGDFGFLADSSALVLVALRGNMVHVFDGLELRPTPEAALKPSTTVAEFAQRIKGRCSHLMADQHHRASIAEHLEEHELAYAPAPMKPSETYVRARMLLREGRVRIHPLSFRDRLLLQMREVQGKPTSGGTMSIVHPRWSKGGHGDACAALVLAVWQVTGEVVPVPTPEAGTKEWEAKASEMRKAKHRAEMERPKWMPAAAGDRGRGAWWRK